MAEVVTDRNKIGSTLRKNLFTTNRKEYRELYDRVNRRKGFSTESKPKKKRK